MKTVLCWLMLSLLVAGASQAQETKKMARKEHRMAKKMDRKAKDSWRRK
jgi:hypothetical protein